MELSAITNSLSFLPKADLLKQTDNSTIYSALKTITNTDPFDSVAVTFEHREETLSFAVYSKKSDAQKQPNTQQADDVKLNQTSETAQLKQLIHAEVLAQVKVFLGAYFKEHPEDLQAISQGEIPEYFNVDNTTRRILDIYFSRYQEGEDKSEFVKRAKSIIEQAYGDVEKMVGTLPDIVQQTRSKVNELLDKFAQGGDISDFMGRTIK
jgi:hypothetical protein